VTDSLVSFSIKTVYKLTALFGLLGFVSYFWVEGVRSAAAFALGAASSFGNLWLFDWLSGTIAPGTTSRKPWQAGAYFFRYLLLLGIGYAIVKTLNVSPVAVLLGLLASAAAVLASLILELVSYFFRSRSSHQ
jgi:hypothetical protein